MNRSWQFITNSARKNQYPAAPCPPNTIVISPSISFRYKTDGSGHITNRNVRVSYRGDQVIKGFHFDADRTACFTADRDCASDKNNWDTNHIGIKSAFLHESINSPVPLCMTLPPSFDGAIKDNENVALICRNIYGTPLAGRSYT